MGSDDRRGVEAVLAYSVLFLFFFHLISDFIAGIYAFGVLGTGIPTEIVTVTLFLSPFLLLLFKRGLGTTTLLLLGELVLLCRVIEIWLPVRFQLLVAGIGTGLFLFLFPALLWNHGDRRNKGVGVLMATALVLAVAASVLLRTLGSTMVLTNEGWFRAISIFLAIGAGILLPRVIQHKQPATEDNDEETRVASRSKTIALSLGISSVILLFYFGFSSPAVLSRWTGSDYLLILSVSVISLVTFAWLLALVRRATVRLTPVTPLFITAGFVLLLTLILAVNQAAFPKGAAGYPFLDPEVSPLWNIALLGLLLLYPVLFLDFGLLTEEMILSRPSMRKLGLGFGLASVFTVIMILANVFTSAWAYIDPVLEPLFRYRFWQIYMLVGIVLTLSMIGVSKAAIGSDSVMIGRRARKAIAGLVTVICICTVASAFFQTPEPTGTEQVDLFVVAGFNLQQGYDADGQRSYREQCEVLKEIDADIVALSESDTARIAGGNFDIVRYLAECLDMNSYVGPKTGIGTFGYALLSKYPIENPETYHLFSGPGLPSSDNPEKVSGGDQVALVKGQITSGGETYNVIVVHFDSNPPVEQALGLVEVAAGLENVIAVGDFNCNPGTECFDIISRELEHCAEQSGEPDLLDGDIDHVFVSPGLQCSGFGYVQNEASDHPVVVAEFD
ncbi:MAG: endonuclease/exonuclease/phosphatase family protein [Candidatus Promineifilaceae bacterium]